jgi:hypothetical protein
MLQVGATGKNQPTLSECVDGGWGGIMDRILYGNINILLTVLFFEQVK